jgi:hypothetical protein
MPSSGKATPLEEDLKKQLISDRNVAQNGRPRDLAHVAKLDEGRTPTDTVYKNADGLVNTSMRSASA